MNDLQRFDEVTYPIRPAWPKTKRAPRGEPDPYRLQVEALDRLDASLERVAGLLAQLVAALEPEPEPDEQRTGEPEPEPPIDEWQPVKAGRAWLLDGAKPGTGLPVVVDRIFYSEGETWAEVVTDGGAAYIVTLVELEPPREARS